MSPFEKHRDSEYWNFEQHIGMTGNNKTRRSDFMMHRNNYEVLPRCKIILNRLISGKGKMRNTKRR